MKKPQATQPVTAAPSYLVGSTYTLQVDSLNVRTGAGVQYHAKKWNELTANARQNAYTNGQLKKGTKKISHSPGFLEPGLFLVEKQPSFSIVNEGIDKNMDFS